MKHDQQLSWKDWVNAQHAQTITNFDETEAPGQSRGPRHKDAGVAEDKHWPYLKLQRSIAIDFIKLSAL